MKILHTADLHLDAVMESVYDPDTANQRRAELLGTFRRMVDYASQLGVRVFLVAGDLFDTPHPTPSTEGEVMMCIAAHPEMDFLILGGTHAGEYIPLDPPKNYHAFPARAVGYYRYDNVVIGGTGNNAAYHELAFSPADVNIMTLHGALSDAITDLSVINLKFWQNLHIDYLALGHIHRAEKNQLDTRGTWAYSGMPEGRDFNETGPKGFLLIEVNGKQVSTAFMPFAQRTLHNLQLDISRLFTLRDIECRIGDVVADIPSSDLVRVVLRGVASPELHIDVATLEAALARRFFYAYVQDETNLSLRPEAYAHDKSLRGEFVRTVLASGLNRADAERIIRCGLRALSGEEVDE